MKTSSRKLAVRVIGVCSILGLAAGAPAQVAIRTGVNAQTRCGLLLPITSTVHAGDSMASLNQTDEESWLAPQDWSLAGVHVLKMDSLSETTTETSTPDANELSAQTNVNGLNLLDGGIVVQTTALEDTLEFNLLTLKLAETETVKASHVTVDGVPYPDLVRHIPAAPGDTAPGTSIPIDRTVTRTILQADGSVKVTEQVSFVGALTLEDPAGSIDKPVPGETSSKAAIYLTGHLGGTLLARPCDVMITVGEIHANDGESESAMAAH